MGRMWALRVVVGQPFSDPSPHFRTCFKGIQIDAFILQGAPQPFNHTIVAPCTFSAHADLNLCVRQYVDPSTAGKLGALDALQSVKQRSEPDLSVCGDAR